MVPLACPPPPPDVPGLVVVVDKSDLALAVYRDGAPLHMDDARACFPVALGPAPAGDKLRQGDLRTPTGTFRVTHKNPNSQFHLSLGLDYPQARHAEAAYARGDIDVATRDRVVAAYERGRMPVRDTALGGDIYLHGGGTGINWTLGCVAVENDVMDWLFAVVDPGAKVHIRE